MICASSGTEPSNECRGGQRTEFFASDQPPLPKNQDLIRRVRATLVALAEQVVRLPRRQIAEEALAGFGAVIVAPDLETAVHLANRIAPEHLELLVSQPYELLGLRSRTPARYSSATTRRRRLADYFAGPNHVLPTAGTARFSSGLSVDHFIKKTSVIAYSETALRRDGRDIIRLAELEGLEAHADSVRIRLNRAGRTPS